MTDRYAVMGNPIAHSKSPAIHARFAAQCGHDLSYEAILVEPGGLARAVAAFGERGGKGINITVPFKEEARRLATTCSARAARAGAVNTLAARAAETWFGDNTDGVGLVRDLTVNQGASIRGRRLLLIGAGGAVRGALGPLLDEVPAAVVIANRTVSKAIALAEAFAGAVPLAGCGFADLEGQRFELVVNGTAASLHGELPPLPGDILAAGACCYDMMYASEPTPFQRWADAHGATRALDGLGMLVEQAAESFLLWRGIRPETAPVIAELRAGLRS